MIQNKKSEELLSFIQLANEERELMEEVRRFEMSIRILIEEAKEAEDRKLIQWAKVLYKEIERYQIGKIKTELEINKLRIKMLKFQLKEWKSIRK